MSAPRKYASNAERQAAYRARCRQMETLSVGLRIPTRVGSRRWAAQIEAARGLLEITLQEMGSHMDDRSEEWQSSERGESFAERLESIEEIVDLLENLT